MLKYRGGSRKVSRPIDDLVDQVYAFGETLKRLDYAFLPSASLSMISPFFTRASVLS